jgi:hypothetical protein
VRRIHDVITITVRNGFFTDDQAAIRARAQHHGFGWPRGVQRVDEKTVTITDDDPLRLYQTFFAAVLLTRGIAE